MKAPKPLPRRQFASDNYSGIIPEVWQALQQANIGHAPAYGEDEWTGHAVDLIRGLFAVECDVFLAFNGTGANSLALAALCRSYDAVVCHQSAHVHTDECGGPEFFTGGAKVLPVDGALGKIEPATVVAMVEGRDEVHFSRPKVVSIAQATEMGTVYRPEELTALAQTCRDLGLSLHVDGARFANACAALRVKPSSITWEAGVDVLSFGCTKLGAPFAEAVVFFNHELSREFDSRRKQAAQLASKMRFLAAPWIGMCTGDTWLRYAAHANDMARRLSNGLLAIPGVEQIFPTEANAVFARLPLPVIRALHDKGWYFYTFVGDDGVRLMCSWDTSVDDVEEFCSDVGDCMAVYGV